MTLTVVHFTRRRNLKMVPWCHTEVVPFKNMINLTFFGSKPSGSPCSPLTWLPQFSFIRFLNDLPLNTYNSFDCCGLVPVTPKWDGEETRKIDSEKDELNSWLYHCFLESSQHRGLQMKSYMGEFIGAEKTAEMTQLLFIPGSNWILGQDGGGAGGGG